jgi:hypothetical protein
MAAVDPSNTLKGILWTFMIQTLAKPSRLHQRITHNTFGNFELQTADKQRENPIDAYLHT